MKQQIRIGTRDSRLAVTQAELLKQSIEINHPDIEVNLVKIKTTGDKILNKTLDKIGGKGLFVKELDLALQEGRTDLSVHSLKDMPMEEDADYPILGFSKREDPQDVLVLPKGCGNWDLEKPAATASIRRSLQLAQLYPGCNIKPIRGNIQTRLLKLDQGEYGALVLAAAGLIRLGLEARINRRFSISEMVPAAGQGILAVQGRKDFDTSLLAGFLDEDAKWQALAERSFVRVLDGGCSSPAAAHAVLYGDTLTLTGFWDDAGSDRGFVVRRIKTPKHMAVSAGEQLARHALRNSKQIIG